jgi:hypothetical protein
MWARHARFNGRGRLCVFNIRFRDGVGGGTEDGLMVTARVASVYVPTSPVVGNRVRIRLADIPVSVGVSSSLSELGTSKAPVAVPR